MLRRILIHNRSSGDEKADSRDRGRLSGRLSGRLFFVVSSVA